MESKPTLPLLRTVFVETINLVRLEGADHQAARRPVDAFRPKQFTAARDQSRSALLDDVHGVGPSCREGAARDAGGHPDGGRAHRCGRPEGAQLIPVSFACELVFSRGGSSMASGPPSSRAARYFPISSHCFAQPASFAAKALARRSGGIRSKPDSVTVSSTPADVSSRSKLTRVGLRASSRPPCRRRGGASGRKGAAPARRRRCAARIRGPRSCAAAGRHRCPRSSA